MKKSQITIFLILGAVLIIIVTVLLLLTNYAAKKTSQQEATDASEASFDVRPIRNYVEGCLSVTSKKALTLLGSQGGYLYQSQGGPFVDFPDTDEGVFFVNYKNYRTAYNILRPDINVPPQHSNPPNYPWEAFPQTASVYRPFGKKTLPALQKGPNPMKDELKFFVVNNIDNCLDFSIFEDFEISKGSKKADVKINENDIVFMLNYSITAESLIGGRKTELKEFISRQNIRVGQMHNFINNIIENDINYLDFDIGSSSASGFQVDVVRDILGLDDLIIVTDTLSDDPQYTYLFVRKNRIPALFHISPENVSVPSGTEITEEILIGSELKAMDPDEDIISRLSFSISPELPHTMASQSEEFKVSVTDGGLADYQTIMVESS